jgi:autotransporter-associated beta strand protein
MNTLVVAAIRCSLLFIVPSVTTYAISAQWELNPSSGDWNTAANWTPISVPNGPGDTATFGLSNTTTVSISADTEVNGITFAPGASAFFISSNDVVLTLSGTGITNNSGVTQTILSSDFAVTQFLNNSTAGSANITNESVGLTQFLNSSTAGSANITNTSTGRTSFGDSSSAGSATIVGFDQTFTSFSDNSTAGSATIVAGGDPDFPGAAIVFSDDSTGGTARIEVFAPGQPISGGTPGNLDISPHNAPGVTVGSIEGDGDVFLGANNLTVGSNNLSTTFSGVIQDGGQNGGTGGSLTKIGTGTLVLSGANTYTGNTNINSGVLQVDGSITSNTFVNHQGTLAGTGTINGNVTNNGTVSPGSAGAPGMLTVTGDYTQAEFAHLMIQIAGMNAGEFSVLDVLGTANLSGLLNPVLLSGFVPTVGETFTFLNYGAVNGTLSIFNPNIDNLPEHWEISYFPTHAILSVVAGNVSVPDQGSTFLLLALGLLGLVTFRRQLSQT